MSDSIDQAERERLLAVLGLDKDATWDTIQSTYIQLMTVWNPDRFHDDLKLKMRIRKKTSEIKIAFAQLEELSGAFSKLQAIEAQRTPREVDGSAFDLTKDLRPDSVRMFKSSIFKDAEPAEEEKEKPKKFESSIGSSLGSSFAHDDVLHEEDQLESPAPTRVRYLAHKATAPLRMLSKAAKAVPAGAYRLYLRSGTSMWMRATLCLTALLVIVPKLKRFDMDAFLSSWLGTSGRAKAQIFDQHMFDQRADHNPPAAYYSSFEGSPLSRLKAASNAGSKLIGSIAPAIQKPTEIFPAGPDAAPSKISAPAKRKGPFKEEKKLAPGLYVYE